MNQDRKVIYRLLPLRHKSGSVTHWDMMPSGLVGHAIILRENYENFDSILDHI